MLEIKTSDLYFAAYLQCVGCEILQSTREKTKTIFVFGDSQDRGNLKENYFNENNDSKISALKYANTIRSLKTYCYVN